MESKDVTVIIPVYNGEKYIDRCLKSLLEQTYRKFKLLLIDDGSKDQSYMLLKEYERKYPEYIEVYQKDNGGAASARNIGLDMLKTKYVMFCDIDDYVEPNYIEVLLGEIEKEDVDMVVCSYYIEEDGKQTSYIQKERKGYLENESELIYETDILLWNKIYRSSVFQQDTIRFPEGIIYEDNATIPRVVARCKNIKFIKDRLYHYVQTQGSVMHMQEGRRSDILKVAETILSDSLNIIYREQYECYVLCLLYSSIYSLITVGEDLEMIEQIYGFLKKNKCKSHTNKCYKRWLIERKHIVKVIFWLVENKRIFGLKVISKLQNIKNSVIIR